MPARPNCWEAMGCGREPGGVHVAELGVCPAAVEERAHGLNRGTRGGRTCWAIAGTLCRGTVRGTFAARTRNCMRCAFYRSVVEAEGIDLLTASMVLNLLDL